MKRPYAEPLEEIEAIIQDIGDAQDAIKELEKRLHETVSGLDEIIHDRDELIELAAYLYWMVPEVRSKSIAESLFGEPKLHLLKKSLPAVTAGILCDRCAAEMPFSSRTQLHNTLRDLKRQAKMGIASFLEGYRIVCEPCREQIFAERKVEDARIRQVRTRRVDQLRKMPYQEYLQTPEWKARRLRHLKSVGYRCQICNASGKTLNVHHRTYIRRGEELYQDLVVLCEDCHETFHREGKLAPGL
jgi:5-methylcytosine-specific restriction endonuclease McrA